MIRISKRAPAHGNRYLNLSAFAAASNAGTKLRLRGSGIRITSRKGHLLGFRNSLPPHPKSLVLAPHPDDAEIATFGLYSRSEACVVTVTSSDQGGFLDWLLEGCPKLSSLTADLRVWDSITVPMLGGVAPDRALNLYYSDGSLDGLFAESPGIGGTSASPLARSLHALQNRNASSLVPIRDTPPTWHTFVDELALLIEKLQPDIIVAPHPTLDGHADHAFTTVGICEALAKSTASTGLLFLHVTHPPWGCDAPGRRDGWHDFHHTSAIRRSSSQSYRSHSRAKSTLRWRRWMTCARFRLFTTVRSRTHSAHSPQQSEVN